MAKQKIIAGHLDHKHGYYYMVLSLPNPEKGNRKLPKWFPTGIPYDGKRQTERDAKRMLKEWREDFTSGKLTLAMIDAKKRSKGTDGAMSLKSIPIRKDMYFTDYLLRWLEIIQADVEEDTFAGYWRTVHNPLLPYFREHNATLEELSAVELTLFYKYCKTRTYRGKPIKGNTIRHYHAVIHKALQDAVVVLRILQYNVADYVVAPKVDNYVAPYADTDELRELVNDLMHSPIRVPVMFAAFYGMRRSEALGIRKAVIDRKKKTITVCHTVIEVSVQGEHKIIRKDRTKNKKSFRTYPLIPQVEAFLDWELQQQEQQRERMGNCYYMGDQDYICLDETGHLLRPDYVTCKFSQLVKKRGLKKITFHGLRHPYVKHTTKIFSLRLMDFQAQTYPDARRKTRGACQLHRGGQSRSPVRPLCNRKRFSCLPPQSKISWILYATSIRLSGYTSTRSISSSASSVVSVSASKIALDASLRLSCRACSSCFCFACANTAA